MTQVPDEERDRRIHDASVWDLVGSIIGDDQLPLFYLSFVDPDVSALIPVGDQRPGGPSWLGACIVPAFEPGAAVAAAHRLGCNPGGEVAIFGPFDRDNFRADYVGRLLTTAEECEAAHL